MLQGCIGGADHARVLDRVERRDPKIWVLDNAAKFRMIDDIAAKVIVEAFCRSSHVTSADYPGLESGVVA